MKVDTILNSVTDILLGIKVGGQKNDEKLARLDRGVLEIALMIAALDGEILPGEVAAYYRMLGKSRGCAKKNAPAVLDAALHKAGYLIALRQTGADDSRLLAAFVEEAQASLPEGFSDGSYADLRRAFVFWTTMALSDGSYSSLERSAVEALAAGFGTVRCGGRSKKSPAKKVSILEEGFLQQIERLVRDLSISAKRAKAQEALDTLVTTVQVMEGAAVVLKPSRNVSVRAGLIALLIAAGMSCPALADGVIFSFGF